MCVFTTRVKSKENWRLPHCSLPLRVCYTNFWSASTSGTPCHTPPAPLGRQTVRHSHWVYVHIGATWRCTRVCSVYRFLRQLCSASYFFAKLNCEYKFSLIHFSFLCIFLTFSLHFPYIFLYIFFYFALPLDLSKRNSEKFPV